MKRGNVKSGSHREGSEPQINVPETRESYSREPTGRGQSCIASVASHNTITTICWE